MTPGGTEDTVSHCRRARGASHAHPQQSAPPSLNGVYSPSALRDVDTDDYVTSGVGLRGTQEAALGQDGDVALLQDIKCRHQVAVNLPSRAGAFHSYGY